MVSKKRARKLRKKIRWLKNVGVGPIAHRIKPLEDELSLLKKVPAKRLRPEWKPHNPYVSKDDPHAYESETHPGKYYSTTKKDCTCNDRFFRKRVCKHMTARRKADLHPCMWCGKDTDGIGFCGRACYKADQRATEAHW